EGTSIGPTSHSVGVVKRGNDLALRIRSGPLGTDCQFTAKVWRLPEAVRLVSMTWELIKEHPDGQASKCCEVDAYQTHCLTPVLSTTPRLDRGTARILPDRRAESEGAYYALTTAANPIQTSDGVTLLDEPSNSRVKTLVKPLWCRLECAVTAI